MPEVKLLVFDIDEEKYGIELDIVQQVVEVPEIMPVPETPDCILGVTNVRGEILPVMDIKKRLNLGFSNITAKSKLIITYCGENKIAFLSEEIPAVIT
ncbi:hypothetical protein DRQ33_08155, partial [bacterium]